MLAKKKVVPRNLGFKEKTNWPKKEYLELLQSNLHLGDEIIVFPPDRQFPPIAANFESYLAEPTEFPIEVSL